VTRTVALGQVLYLALPLPKRLRQFDLNDASYRVYALVRGIEHGTGRARIGVMFFGKFPPRGFHEKPWARFLLPSDSQMSRRALDPWPGGGPSEGSDSPAPGNPVPPATPPPQTPLQVVAPAPADASRSPPPDPSEQRRSRRVDIFVNFTIQQVDEWGAVLQQELIVADNLGKGGARVMTTLDFRKGDVVILQEAGGGFATRAEVRDVRQGADGITRLHLKFLDRQTPDRLLREG
jgi:hypothetical protein